MDQILGQIGAAIGGFFDNPIVHATIQATIVYVIILWLAAAYWAFRDMQLRTENPILPYFAASLIIVFTPIFFPLAVFAYRIVRPQEKIAEVFERNLAEEALLAEVEAIKTCPTCGRRTHEEWIICPTCRTRLNRVCPNCSRLVGLDWSLCAWCGKDFERREVAAVQPLPAIEEPERLVTSVQPALAAASAQGAGRAPRSLRASAARAGSNPRATQDPLPER
jgi:RNA polymerase subunit RPABC4/transcription elongation factor Spt4